MDKYENNDIKIKIGVIGGTGLEEIGNLIETKKEIDLKETPYGWPSQKSIKCCKLNNVELYPLTRHGLTHDISPSNVNYRANLWILKELGCEIILATTATGSLKEKIKPGTLCILDQYIDRTKSLRNSTFYKVCHIPQDTPFDKSCQKILQQALKKNKADFFDNVTVVTIEGPRFSTKAESNLYRSWNVDLVNMTTCPEVSLAAELGLPYVSLALVTDYDSWHLQEEENVNVELVTNRLSLMKNLVVNVIKDFALLAVQENLNHCIQKGKDRAKVALMCV